MALFKKRKDRELSELPNLPEMPAFPELPKEEKKEEFSKFTLPTLPSLPVSKPMDFEQIMMPVMKPMTMEISEEKDDRIARLREPIFVKIEKYRDALASLETIKKKLRETSNLLEKIKETRAKEEEELILWADEINSIKDKIEAIDKKLFNA